MRIAFVTETWLPATDGIVTRLHATITALLDEGHHVLIVCPRSRLGNRADSRSDPRATVRTVPTIGFDFLYGGQRWGLPLPTVAGYLRHFRPDVVHLVNPVLLGIAGALAARYQRIPVVASYHTNVSTYAGYYHLGVLRPLIEFTLRSLHRQASLNLATSGVGEQELHRLGARNVRRWPRGVDLDLFRPNPAPARHDGRPVALYVGRLAAEKGLQRLRPLSTTEGGFDLVLVGHGPQRDELPDLLGPTARFTGLQHGERLARTYRAADVFVFPSTTDTLGLAVLEGLASGLPVVAVDSRSSRELLAGCPAARVVPADDPAALARAARELVGLRRTNEGPELSKVARQLAEGCGWGEATAYLVDCYEELVSAARATDPRPPPSHRPTR